MFKQRDQAEGLRRMMSPQTANIVNMLCLAPQPQRMQLMHMAAQRLHSNQRLLLIQHQALNTFTAPWPSLSAVARGESTRNLVTRPHPMGFDCAYLIENNPLSQALSAHEPAKLASIVQDIATRYDTVMIDTQLNEDHSLPLPALAAHAMVIQMGNQPADIKAAYTTIKHLCGHYGDRTFGIMVYRATALQAQHAFLRLQQVCLQFLGISLQFVGALSVTESPDHAATPSSTMHMPSTHTTQTLDHVASRLKQTGKNSLVAA